MRTRVTEERLLAGTAQTFTSFRFRDRQPESGITFTHQIVDDAGLTYKAVHYDHGTGLCALDADTDGRTDLFFVTQRGRNALYRNVGGGRFADVTDSAGLGATDRIGVSCAVGDIDNDGRPDLFLTTVRHGNQLFRNEGGRFRDITAQAGVGYVGHSSGAVFFDYDNDGRLDLFVANVGRYTANDTGRGGAYVGLTDAFHGHLHPDRAESSLLYRNLGDGRFAEVSAATGLIDRGWNGDATVLDVDGDGRPDLYVASMQGPDKLWRNVGGTRFVDETARWFPRTPFGAMGLATLDVDGDGQLDLFVTDMHSDMIDTYDPGDFTSKTLRANASHIDAHLLGPDTSRLILGNALFVRRDDRYEESATRWNAETYWPWGASAADLNGDGWEDLFVTASMNFPYPYQPNDLLLNGSGKRFLQAAFALGVEPRRHGATEQVWFTAACGPTGADRAQPMCDACLQGGASARGCTVDAQGKATMVGAKGSRASVVFDIDGDGDLDVVTNEFNTVPQVLLSDLSERRALHWLSVRLRGTASNRMGLGAVVTVTLPGGRRLVRAHTGQSGYLSHSDLPLWFGLDTADAAESIEVRWPSGRTQRVAGPVKGALEIVEAP
ncbi:MAG: CRTAC1 family protein [Gemmatimonadetes bacterium]|nr:CRTAC1 family protein [Gemmatimonadota bacterium]